MANLVDREVLYSLMSRDLDGMIRPSNAVPLGNPGVLRPRGYDVDLFRKEYQLYNLNRKANPGQVLETHRSDAFSLFTQLNEHNEKFSCEQTDELKRIQDVVRALLPEFDFVKEDVWSLCTFGPGTFNGSRLPRRNSKRGTEYSLHYKIGGNQTVTPQAKSLACKVILTYFPSWAEVLKGTSVTTVNGNRITHVTKDIKKCRQIAIEPSLNVFLQQGIGRFLGQHMKSVGFADIYDGQGVNRRLAGISSNATIDLSSASDTISSELVKLLLPWDWWAVLNTVRSHSYEYRGNEGLYHGFSSQGNAFTFPLETLIFKAILMGGLNLSSREVTVYGDDIIVPVDRAHEACLLLEKYGFIPNREKSFFGQHATAYADFRESCGADYYQGVDVTPVYYRDECHCYSDVASLFNRLFEKWGHLDLTHEYLLSCVPKSKRRFGPRLLITDDLSPFEGRTVRNIREFEFNRVISVYDSYFWSVGKCWNEEHSARWWGTTSVQINKADVISDEVYLREVLLKSDLTLPRASKPVTRKAVYTVPYGYCSEFDLGGDADRKSVV